MICPYCSIDIEPIELNGKTFCSNCGLGINIPIKPDSPAINDDIKPITVDPLDNPAKDLIESSNNKEPIQANEVRPMSSELESVPEIEEKIETPVEQTSVKDQEDISQEPEILMNILDQNITDTNDINFPTNPTTFDESVKNMDSLAGAGILLDILGDEQSNKETSDKISALEAAEELLDDININKDDDKPSAIRGAAKFEPQNGIKLKVDILDQSIVNPTTHPELEAGPEELDLPLPTEEAETTNIEELDLPLPNKETETLGTSEEIPIATATTEKIEDTLDINAAEDSNLDSFDILLANKRAKEESTPPLTTNSEPSTSEIVTATETEGDAIETTESKISNQDAPTIKGEEEFFEKTEKKKIEPVFSEKESILNTLTSNHHKQNNNSEHLKDYFSSIIKIEHETPSKKKKSKKKKQNKKLIQKSLLVGGLIIILSLLGLGIYYFKPTDIFTPTIQVAEGVESKPNFTIIEPREIPYGYQKVEENFDSEKQSYNVSYDFIGNSDRKINFYQISSNTADIENKLKEQINQQNGSFGIKTTEGTNYTVFENGTTIWSKDNFVFVVEVSGDTFKDQIEKMVLSVE